ncbi:uncharacterized protein LOC128718191 [Anopheles marshallii]|uniref:uncharacterized protein LOC128718191 n=1 Tax=Anopheles marshallii TaxID=1521116 RepID=UPI00237B2B58|nr:uncharacterized protein LOC128718191 [Anopheles marshallii]
MQNSADNANVLGSAKAAVHINGVAVDHFHQNSDVDEDRRSQCQNNDIQGFISYSSDSSMIELNLKFRKCACNENIINISKENLQQMQRTSPTGAAESTNADSSTVGTAIVGPGSGVFRKEGKSKKMLAINKGNLNRLMCKLNDSTDSPSSSCTKCRLSLDVKHILKQLVNIKTKKDTVECDGIGCSRSPGADDSCSRRSALPLTIDDSMMGLRADDSLIGSSASPLPSPNSPVPVIGPLERRHSETVERRSIGIQHASRHHRKKTPLLRTHGKSIPQAEEIIIISDEFRRQSLRDQQSIRVQKSPKKISKSMESIDKRHPLSLSLRPVAIRSFQLPSTVHGLDPADEMLTIVVNTTETRESSTSKSISKSVDDMSLGPSGKGDELSAHPKSSEPASDDVELIFISDEFVKRKSKSSSDVIIVQNAADRRRESSRRKKPTKTLSVAGVEGHSTEQKRLTNAGRPVSTEGRIVKSATIPVAASPGTKAKNVRRKTTISNSNSFLTYEEPFSPETLENKDIGQLFAEASIE